MKSSPQLIAKVLAAFLAIAQKDSNKFDKKDIENLNKTNYWGVERFILVHKTEEEALKALTATMEWRKSFGVNDLNEKMFKDFKPGKHAKNRLNRLINQGHSVRDAHYRRKGQKWPTDYVVLT